MSKYFGNSGQGALEYLIITAAVLAIAAVVILFLTDAFGASATSASISACQTSTSDCANKIATLGADNAVAHCESVCNTACLDPRTGNTIPNGEVDDQGRTSRDICETGSLADLNAFFGSIDTA